MAGGEHSRAESELSIAEAELGRRRGQRTAAEVEESTALAMHNEARQRLEDYQNEGEQAIAQASEEVQRRQRADSEHRDEEGDSINNHGRRAERSGRALEEGRDDLALTGMEVQENLMSLMSDEVTAAGMARETRESATGLRAEEGRLQTEAEAMRGKVSEADRRRQELAEESASRSKEAYRDLYRLSFQDTLEMTPTITSGNGVRSQQEIVLRPNHNTADNIPS